MEGLEELVAGTSASTSGIARRGGITPRYVAQHIDLAFLSPSIVEAILQGRQPVELTAQSVKLCVLPADWQEQAAMLNFQ